jgi:hypothetical protein
MTDLLLQSSGPVANEYEMLPGDLVVGYIRISESAPMTKTWCWTLSRGRTTARRTPTHGYGATREEALQGFARSWQMRKAPGTSLNPRPPASVEAAEVGP